MPKVKVKIDGQSYDYFHPKEFIIDLFRQILWDSKYRSLDNLKENILGVISLSREAVDGQKENRSLATKLTRSLKWFSHLKTKEEMISKSYDLILSIEGMGLLSGFSYQQYGNQEK